MKTSSTISSLGALEATLRKQFFDPRLKQYKSFLLPKIPTGDVTCLGPHYPYICDLHNGNFDFMDPGLFSHLGLPFPKKRHRSLKLLELLIHPADLIPLCQAYQYMFKQIVDQPQERRRQYKMSLGFRLIRNGDIPIHVLQVVSQFVFDN